MLCCHLKLSFSPEPWKKSTLLLLPSSPTPSVMREYFPRVWKQIPALLLETLLNQPDQLFLCLPSFWQVTIHSIRLVNVNVKWIFLWVSDQWCLPTVVQYLPVALLAVWAEEMCDWEWSSGTVLATPQTRRDFILMQKSHKEPAGVKSFIIESPS